LGILQVAQLVMPHRLARDLQASITPTGVETDLKRASEEKKKRTQE